MDDVISTSSIIVSVIMTLLAISYRMISVVAGTFGGEAY